MFSLYMTNVGQDRFEVIRVLTGEYQVPFADAKTMLTGARPRLCQRNTRHCANSRKGSKRWVPRR